jgi:hypothetical protein
MRAIFIGCEYVGKTALASELVRWLQEKMGDIIPMHGTGLHDHFTPPYIVDPGTPTTEMEMEYVSKMPPVLLEKYQRYQIEYNFGFWGDDHHISVNWYFGDMVYAPLYLGFGARDTYGDREMCGRMWDAKVMKDAPDTVLILVKASPETVLERMRAKPQPRCIVTEENYEMILKRFEEEHAHSIIRKKVTIDTSGKTVEQSFRELLGLLRGHFTHGDMARLAGQPFLS